MFMVQISGKHRLRLLVYPIVFSGLEKIPGGLPEFGTINSEEYVSKLYGYMLASSFPTSESTIAAA